MRRGSRFCGWGRGLLPAGRRRFGTPRLLLVSHVCSYRRLLHLSLAGTCVKLCAGRRRVWESPSRDAGAGGRGSGVGGPRTRPWGREFRQRPRVWAGGGRGGGLEFLEGGEGAVAGGAGGVDVLLEAGEVLVAFPDCLGGREPAFHPGKRTAEVGVGEAEAAEGPFAGDEFVDEEARFGGRQAGNGRSIRF
jgi:hypothetical protein